MYTVQTSSLPSLLPSRNTIDTAQRFSNSGRLRSASALLQHGSNSRRPLAPPSTRDHHNLRFPVLRSSIVSPRLGFLSRHPGRCAGMHPVSPAHLHNLPAEESGELEHTDDVHTDTGKLCLGGESCGEAGE